jgi:hypothetical protein
MNDDYLWDKSGEPDPEIERLEELLGELRYRHPAGELLLTERAAVASNARRFTLPLAIAASLLFMLMAAGIWFALGSGGRRETAGLAAIDVRQVSAANWPTPKNLALMTEVSKAVEDNKPVQELVATAGQRNIGPRRVPAFKRRAATAAGGQIANLSSPNRRQRVREDDEGVAARDQLIQALRLASSKLNLVQKKVQDNKGQSLGPVS